MWTTSTQTNKEDTLTTIGRKKMKDIRSRGKKATLRSRSAETLKIADFLKSEFKE